MGDGVRLVAIPVLAATATGDARAVSLVTAAEYLPWVLFGLIGGVVVDRVDRRRLIGRVDLLRTLLVAGLAVAFGGVGIRGVGVTGLIIASFLLGALAAPAETAASAILPSLVVAGRLERANGLLQGIEITSVTFLGPPLGGLLLAAAAAAALGLDAFSFLLSALLALSLPVGSGSVGARDEVGRDRPAGSPAGSSAGPPGGTGLLGEVADGLRWLGRHRLLRTLCGLVAVGNLAYAAGFAVLVLYARHRLGLGPTGYGLLFTAAAAGSLLGAVVAGPARRLGGLAGVVTGSFAGQLLGLLAVGLAGTTAAAAAGLAVYGAATMVWNVVTVALRQAIVPDRLLGRVTSAYRVVAYAAMPVGALSGGVVGSALGLRAPYLLGAALVGLAAAVGLPVLWRLPDVPARSG